jgi:3-oxoacyl-[acyl-carrier protein] reductase
MERRVALITGGARGIGKAIAMQLARDGWTIAICYRTSQDAAQHTLQSIQEIQSTDDHILAMQCDVSDSNAAKALVEHVQGTWNRIDALINCAGPYHRVPLLEETVEGWNAMFQNNLHPVFYLSREIAAGMKERRWGRIINFSMANADQMVAQTHVTAHYIAKAGVLILTRSLAKALAPYGITVNAISPGFIDSGSAPAEELSTMVKRIPAGYIGDVNDTVSAVKFLLSDEARYVNGTNMHVSGGWGI